jgi:hypothetical protein
MTHIDTDTDFCLVTGKLLMVSVPTRWHMHYDNELDAKEVADKINATDEWDMVPARFTDDHGKPYWTVSNGCWSVIR